MFLEGVEKLWYSQHAQDLGDDLRCLRLGLSTITRAGLGLSELRAYQAK